MFWIILACTLMVAGIAILIYGEEKSNGGWLLTLSIVIFALVVSSAFGWYKMERRMKMMPIMIEDKRLKIEDMKKTYFEQPKANVNIDMANKELAVSINNELVELERFINAYNVKIADWQTAYKHRFFYCCFIDPKDVEPIKY